MTFAADVSLEPGRPPVVRAEGATAEVWLAEHRDALRDITIEHGAALVRGLELRTVAVAAAAMRQVIAVPTAEREPFATREEFEHGVYSSSAWPPDQSMCMHHECSYAIDPPATQVFCCLVAPLDGGATALADAAAVLADLPSPIVERFAQVGWELRRTHNDFVGVPWPEAFGTTDLAEVERYCRDNAITWSWEADGSLRTSRRRRAVIRHPVTGRHLWFNQVAFLSEWTMESAVRDYLTAELGSDALPFNTLYGDGEPLDRTTVDVINDVYAAHTVREPWQAGDLLIVDNLRTAHSRDRYRGPRRILVAMGDAVRLADL